MLSFVKPHCWLDQGLSTGGTCTPRGTWEAPRGVRGSGAEKLEHFRFHQQHFRVCCWRFWFCCSSPTPLHLSISCWGTPPCFLIGHQGMPPPSLLTDQGTPCFWTGCLGYTNQKWLKTPGLDGTKSGILKGCHPAHGTNHGSTELVAGQQWHCFPSTRFLDSWAAPGLAHWIRHLIPVHRGCLGPRDQSQSTGAGRSGAWTLGTNPNGRGQHWAPGAWGWEGAAPDFQDPILVHWGWKDVAGERPAPGTWGSIWPVDQLHPTYLVLGAKRFSTTAVN